MKLYELLAKIAKGEAKDGIRFKWNKVILTYRFYEFYNEAENYSFSNFSVRHLNDEVEIIEPAPDKNVATKIEELKIEFEIGKGNLGLLADIEDYFGKLQVKLNEVIRAVNSK